MHVRDRAPKGAVGGSLSPVVSKLRNQVPELAWGAFATAILVVMLRLSAWQTVPFHFIWLSISVLYGFRMWRVRSTLVALAVVMLVTGYAGLSAEDRRDLAARLAANARRLNRLVTARPGPAAARGGRACTGPDGRWGSGQERARRTGMAPPQQDP